MILIYGHFVNSARYLKLSSSISIYLSNCANSNLKNETIQHKNLLIHRCALGFLFSTDFIYLLPLRK